MEIRSRQEDIDGEREGGREQTDEQQCGRRGLNVCVLREWVKEWERKIRREEGRGEWSLEGRKEAKKNLYEREKQKL